MHFHIIEDQAQLDIYFLTDLIYWAGPGSFVF
jgi:hypothetical protein